MVVIVVVLFLLFLFDQVGSFCIVLFSLKKFILILFLSCFKLGEDGLFFKVVLKLLFDKMYFKRFFV